jgi:Thioesterase domain
MLAINNAIHERTTTSMMNLGNFSAPHIQASIHMVQKAKATAAPRLPFFFLHGDWSGEVPFYCFTLARLLGPTQPFYALDTYKYNSPDAPLTLEEVAAAHLQSIRATQPEGPYLLGGFCNGSYLAYEVARQLGEQGQKVELLVLIAPSEITHYHQQVRRALSIMGTFFHISQAQQLGIFISMRHLLRSIYRKILSPDNLKIKDVPKLLAMDSRLDKTFPPLEALCKDFPGVFTWMAAGFTPKYIPGNVAFIWAAENLSYRSRWSLIERGQNSSVLPGHYRKFLNENIDLLAEQLKIFIDKVQEDYVAYSVPSVAKKS